ncbi:MAG: tRNA (guanosine(18)-2'-O)-methyltransferase TrmH [Gammaproteobacteria bacterium]|nr:tRNA (guanosine(18)-2'-O)-methyltransferase TrmH [Gammaproteobacteria bacterium]
MQTRRFLRIKQLLDHRQPDLTVLMEQVHKPRNLAAVLRSADAVGVLNTHLVPMPGLDLSRRPKAAAGTRPWVPLQAHKTITQAYSQLKQQGFRLVAAHPDESAIDFRQLDYTGATCLVFGSELRGMSTWAVENADCLVSIPTVGMAQSLNVSVAAALILYEAQRQRQNSGQYSSCRIDSQTYKHLLFEWTWPKIARHCQRLKIPYPAYDLNNGHLLEDVPRG